MADDVVRDTPPEDWQQQLAEVASYGRFDTVLRLIDGWRPQSPAGDIPEEMVENAVARVAHEVYEAWRVTANRDAYVGDAIRAAASEAVDAVLAGRALVALPAPDDTTNRLGGAAEWSVPGGVIGVYPNDKRVWADTAGGHMTAADAVAEGAALIAAARAALQT